MQPVSSVFYKITNHFTSSRFTYFTVSRDSSYGIAPKLGAAQLRNRGSIPERGKRISSSPERSGANPASYPWAPGDLCHGKGDSGVKLATYIYLVPSLRMRGVIPPPHSSIGLRAHTYPYLSLALVNPEIYLRSNPRSPEGRELSATECLSVSHFPTFPAVTNVCRISHYPHSFYLFLLLSVVYLCIYLLVLKRVTK
jgi:hypothetical protein